MPRLTIGLVKNGRWILEMVGQDHNYRGYHCSECGYRLPINPRYTPNYCEYCGARMENGHMKDQEW